MSEVVVTGNRIVRGFEPEQEARIREIIREERQRVIAEYCSVGLGGSELHRALCEARAKVKAQDA